MDERFDQVEGQIADTRMEMRTTANGLRSEVQELRGELKTSTNELRGEIKEQGKELRREISSVDRNLRQEIAGVEARLRTQASEHLAESREQFDRVDEGMRQMHEDMRQMSAAILGLHHTMTRIAWSAAIAVVATVIGVLLANL